MENLQLSQETLGGLVWLLVLLGADYVGVIAAVAVDLRSGLRKSTRLGRRHTSRGYRRTVDKALRYLATLLSLTLVDLILVLTALCLRITAGWSLPALPWLTTAGALFMMLVEAKSVVENLHEGSDLAEAARSLSKLLADKRLHDLARRIIER